MCDSSDCVIRLSNFAFENQGGSVVGGGGTPSVVDRGYRDNIELSTYLVLLSSDNLYLSLHNTQAEPQKRKHEAGNSKATLNIAPHNRPDYC